MSDWLISLEGTEAGHQLALALALLLVRRPWAPAVAVVVGMPSLWLGTLVILAAVVRLWFDQRRGRLPAS